MNHKYNCFRWLTGLGFLLLAFLTGFIVMQAVGNQPQLSFDVKVKGDTVEFSMALRNADGLDEFLVYDKEARRILWYVQMDYYPGPLLEYGRLPSSTMSSNGVPISPKQVFPATTLAPMQLEIGKEYIAQIGYAYDNWGGPSGTAEWFAFILDLDGHVSYRKAQAQEMYGLNN